MTVKDAINEHSKFVTSGVRNGAKMKSEDESNG